MRQHYNQDGAPGQDGFAKGVSRPYHTQREPQTEEEQMKRGEADQFKKELSVKA
jgi:hypothetical protein